ncbi:hypothetical protein BaOVIS_001800 [Babesia ovis]|uniref:Uncharacterized protein n=1 Tax=Babesia ovis TaxID=5869 RepID=A0A9W5T8M8_BABOV|nr:hypothetical protein BaOVIS_001800 [Babesia ovis]
MEQRALSSLLNGGAQKAWRNSILRAKLDIFGSIKGMPGEEEWSKPLRGRSRTRWYWPSKYLHMDFSLRHYLAMQLRRLEARRQHPSIKGLWDTVELFNRQRDAIEAYMKNVDEEKRKKSTTLQDAQAVLQMIAHKSNAQLQESDADPTRDGTKYYPYIKYALRSIEETEGHADSSDGGRKQFRQMITMNHSIKKILATRNRFVDALYLRRRAYYLEKLSRKKPVGETIQKYRKHFTVHPDHKDIWPDNKGISQHSWPSR